MEGKDSFRPDDQHDVAAFMRIFMDMMGMSHDNDLHRGIDDKIFI
jgi:hypothetical protein